jgi:hypothetical protein
MERKRAAARSARAECAARSREVRGRQRRTDSVVMLRAAAIKRHLPCIDAEVIKFWLLASAHGNELAVSFAGVDAHGRLGYHPEERTELMRACEDVGLLRYIQRGGRDHLTRRLLPNVYQFNPDLYYVRRKLKPAALAATQTPFNPLPVFESRSDSRSEFSVDPRSGVSGLQGKSLIGDSPSNADHNQYEVSNANQPKQFNQRKLTNTTNRSLNERESLIGGETGSEAGTEKPRVWSRSNQPNGKEPTRSGKPARSAPEKNPLPPTPLSAEAPAEQKSRYGVPLADEHEALAQELFTVCTQPSGKRLARLWQCRQLVDEFGTEAGAWGIPRLRTAIQTGGVNNPFGLLKSWLLKRMSEAEPALDGIDTQVDGKRFISGMYADFMEH